MTLAIEAYDLRKTYGESVTALDGMSLAVPSGAIFGLLGPNGAGKSTTVKILSTLSRADSGSARVAGIDVALEPRAVRHAIGVVGQKHGADPEATGRENLQLQGIFYGLAGAELAARVDRSLQRFGLVEAADRKARTYSGGMQRRLDVAMGLLHGPQVLFLDEPTTGLDPEARADLWLEIERLSVEERMTILLTTHYMDEADRLASQLAIVDRGHVVAQGTPAELKSGLAGDTIQIELDAEEPQPARAALEEIRGVEQCELDGSRLRARCADGAAAIPAVLARLEERGIAARSVTLARPSLDDVYLRHAGRAFHTAQSQREEVAA
jgi:ABC-2 type transport system ATP-binding protein